MDFLIAIVNHTGMKETRRKRKKHHNDFEKNIYGVPSQLIPSKYTVEASYPIMSGLR